KTYWDRSALYAMRGLFCCGESEAAYKMLNEYTKERLLGCHPPYPVEAFPEGNSAQLAAESALYLRIFTEGILGYRPTGLSSFEIKPNLPNAWERIAFENMHFFGKRFDISVENKQNYIVTINGEKIEIIKGEKYIYKAEL
ncbi:MAG: glycosyl hydrolase family 65 protein, partial [Acutalibacteraceae bacterium]